MDDINSKVSIACNALREFFASDKKCMIVKGTARWEKHKIIMCALNEIMSGGHFLFRSEGLQTLTTHSVLGWAGIEKTPSSGKKTRIGNNIYEFDSMFSAQTKRRTSHSFDGVIVYPVESILCSQKYSLLDELFQPIKQIPKIILVTNHDNLPYDYSVLEKYKESVLILNQ